MTTLSTRGRAAKTVHPASITLATLVRWGGASSVLAGVLTMLANLLHPPRSFATLARDAQRASWEPVHLIAIAAVAVSAFALIALYAVQIERVGLLGLIGFVGAHGGSILTVGLLVPDALIFPALAGDPAVVHLLDVPGPLIGGGVFTVYMALSGAVYSLGTLLFFAVSARAVILPRSGSLLIAFGIVPLVFGALIQPGVDDLGAVLVGLGYLRLGVALWLRTPGHAGAIRTA